MKEFKSTPETDNELLKMAEFLGEQQKKIDDLMKENSFNYAWCDTCLNYIHEDDQEWINGDQAVCPKCGTNLEM